MRPLTPERVRGSRARPIASAVALAIIVAVGAMVMPGFQDTHVHVPEAGINAGLCFVSGQDLAELETQAAACAVQQQDSAWVLGAGASLFGLRDTDELPVDALDRAVADRPALILDDLGHAVWTNSQGPDAIELGTRSIVPRFA